MQTKLPFFKKLLAVALFFVAIFCCKAFAVSVTAEESANTPPTAIATAEYTILAQGTCGTNLTWQLTGDYALSITGTGEMNSYGSYSSPWQNYASSIKKIHIGAEVTSIGNFAFYKCSGLISVTLPNSVKSIGASAFNSCFKLVEVINYSSLNITKGSSNYGRIGENALNVKTSGTTDIVNKDGYLFYTYNNVNYLLGYSGTDTNLVLPDSYNGQSYQIYNYAFYNCNELTSINIPDNVTSIGESAFSNCSALTSINIPDNVTSIGYYAFSNCSALTSINIPDNVTSIGYDAFYGCSSLTSITIPDKVTSIGYYAFYGCSSLTSITIPDKVTSIGKSAFSNCSALTSINIPDKVTSIGYAAFYGCSALASINIPDNVTSIGSSAFEDCSALTSINIPDNVTSIGYYAFSYCSALTSINIPDKVTSIGDYAFRGCGGLKAVYISDIVAWCNISFTTGTSNPLCYAKKLYLNNILVTDLVIPITVTSIGSNAFIGCSALTSINIPDNVTSIGYSAFEDCSALTSINIPDNVSSIGYYAFSGCSALNDIFIYSPQVSIYQNSSTLPEQTVIHGYLNSTAQEYATKYNRKFVLLECDECTFEEKSKTEATCTQKGKIVKVCKTCGKTVEEPLAALGHTKNTFTALKEATCTQAGKLGYYYCSACNNYLDENENVIGTTETDLVIPAKGHTYGDWIKEIPATCTQPGKLGYYYCSACNSYLDKNENVIGATETDLVIPAKGHSHGVWIKEIPATCTQAGKLGYYYCSACNNYLDENENVIGNTEADLVIPAKGHTYGDWIKEIPATCAEYGVLGHYHCSECQNDFDNKKQLLLTIVIEKTEHNYKNKQTYPTCTEDGKIEYTCQNCQDKKVEIIAATGHKYGAWQDDVKPSCDQEGSKHRNCTACDNSETAKVLP